MLARTLRAILIHPGVNRERLCVVFILSYRTGLSFPTAHGERAPSRAEEKPQSGSGNSTRVFLNMNILSGTASEQEH